MNSNERIAFGLSPFGLRPIYRRDDALPRADVGLYDHAIFATHSIAFQMLMATVLIVLDLVGVPARLVWLTAAIIAPIHLYRHLQGTYGLGRAASVWRTMALLGMTAIAVALFFGFLFWIELR